MSTTKAESKSGEGHSSAGQNTRAHILDTALGIVGAKGFAQVGLNEVLAAAKVPKGSFYYYFKSKEAFGKALLEHYFDKDGAQADKYLFSPGKTARQRLSAYWAFFRANQEHHDPVGKCLAVKLGAEVSDMSEEMRLALKIGTSSIISKLARVIKEGKTDGSIPSAGSPTATAQTIFQLWMGASVMWKISRERSAFQNANAAVERIMSGEAV